ncbi:hypothetical protein I7I53_01257 [Histoplasma capsulatum var. duboisii H88]|uniref:Uncharacterized protein n=1 Tax=Ajellomyces capsulatus (strain H88) TaxID=544711 RepID=A0A8A1LIU0_AJEC8|nr:hypothetical protein I7I53_01257 [Histoplasma capsulatum var. duboisii H88]
MLFPRKRRGGKAKKMITKASIGIWPVIFMLDSFVVNAPFLQKAIFCLFTGLDGDPLSLSIAGELSSSSVGARLCEAEVLNCPCGAVFPCGNGCGGTGKGRYGSNKPRIGGPEENVVG